MLFSIISGGAGWNISELEKVVRSRVNDGLAAKLGL
jgi:hypothetical protein